MHRGRLFLYAAVVFGVCAPATVWGAGPHWELVEDSSGIKVWSLDIPGKDLPGFRGVAAMDATIDEILKEILDYKSHTEWMWRSRESVLIKRITETRGLLYNRVHAPWPIKDRDMVLETDYRFTPDHKALTILFRKAAQDPVPVRSRVIRVPSIEGFYRLWELSPTRTNVLYQVEVDIGGNVPDHSARRYARKLPFNTLEALRKRVESKRGAK
jgi:hypothetical protein